MIDTRKIGSGQPSAGTLAPPVDVVDSACDVPSTAARICVQCDRGSFAEPELLDDLAGRRKPTGVSTLNAADGWVTSNMAIVPSVNGNVDAYAAGMTQLILDISSLLRAVDTESSPSERCVGKMTSGVACLCPTRFRLRKGHPGCRVSVFCQAKA